MTAIDRRTGQETVPKSYILCAEDRAIPPAYQAQMSSDFAPGYVTDLLNSHSSFLSDPPPWQRLDAIAGGLGARFRRGNPAPSATFRPMKNRLALVFILLTVALDSSASG